MKSSFPFWECEREALDGVFGQIEEKHGGRTLKEVELVWSEQKTRMALEVEREALYEKDKREEDKRETRLLGVGNDPLGSMLVFERSVSGPTKGWEGGAVSVNDVYWAMGVESLEDACRDRAKARALIREVFGCYSPRQDIRWLQKVRSEFGLNREQNNECKIVAILRDYGVSRLEEVETLDATQQSRICPQWKVASHMLAPGGAVEGASPGGSRGGPARWSTARK